jgi:hypothetical protein
MSWRDTLAAAPHNSHNPHNYQPTGVSEDCGDIGDRAQAYDSYVSTRADELRVQAQSASTWAELYGVLEAAQADFDTRAVTREEVESLRGYASDRSREVPEHAEDGRLSDLLARHPVVRVRSRLLGEVVVWVADGVVDITEEIVEVVYRESELRQLVGRTPTEVRTIHKVKRALDGELM